MKYLKLGAAMVMIGLLVSCGGKKESKAKDFAAQAKMNKLLTKNTCSTCHQLDTRLVGPSYKEIAERGYDVDRLVALIKKPEPENWPDYPVPMVGLPHLDERELKEIASWITTLNQ